VDFGESGKNFIEIGKRHKVRETMLRRAVPLRWMNSASWRNHAGTQTWKKQFGSFGPQIGLHGNELLTARREKKQEIGL
jgi:hypothetical protein